MNVLLPPFACAYIVECAREWRRSAVAVVRMSVVDRPATPINDVARRLCPWIGHYETSEQFYTQDIRIPLALTGKLIGVDGPICAGKTTFIENVQRSAQRRSRPFRAYFEDEHRSVLPAFCANPSALAAMMQMHMHAHAKQRRRFGREMADMGHLVMQDRTERGNYNFAAANREHFAALEWRMFCAAVDQPWYRGVDALVYFDVTVDTTLRRLQLRGNQEEKAYTREYLLDIERHNYWMVVENARAGASVPALVVTWDADYHDMQPILNRVDAAVRGDYRPPTMRIVFDTAFEPPPGQPVLVAIDMAAIAIMRTIDSEEALERADIDVRRWFDHFEHLSTSEAPRTYHLDAAGKLDADDAIVRATVLYLLARPDTRTVVLINPVHGTDAPTPGPRTPWSTCSITCRRRAVSRETARDDAQPCLRCAKIAELPPRVPSTESTGDLADWEEVD